MALETPNDEESLREELGLPGLPNKHTQQPDLSSTEGVVNGQPVEMRLR